MSKGATKISLQRRTCTARHRTQAIMSLQDTERRRSYHWWSCHHKTQDAVDHVIHYKTQDTVDHVIHYKTQDTVDRVITRHRTQVILTLVVMSLQDTGHSRSCHYKTQNAGDLTTGGHVITRHRTQSIMSL